MSLLEDLSEVFNVYAGDSEMDGRTFIRLLKETGLLDDRFRMADADLIFAKCKAKHKRKIDFSEFSKALEEVGRKKDMSLEAVIDLLCEAAWPDDSSDVSSVMEEDHGPQRFFYDRSTYTSTHKLGGPSVTLGCDVVTAEGLVNRDRSNEIAASAERRRLGQRDHSRRLNTLDDDEYSIPTSVDAPPCENKRTSSRRTPSPSYGPERFYYDRSTFTGTHRNGGPSPAGNGLQKEGYGDLSELVRRDIVQDDALHRRQRSPSTRLPSKSSTKTSPKTSPQTSARFVAVDIESVAAPESPPLPVLLGSTARSFQSAAEKLKEPTKQPSNASDPLFGAIPPPRRPGQQQTVWTSQLRAGQGQYKAGDLVRTSLFLPLFEDDPVSQIIPARFTRVLPQVPTL
eukprot:TRINITY_DN12275_c2_g1_i1.p1 TRINITY_DN12275_c2_g1~~TRINITY_DN12275_c2_g1_i1.p1  ORF type:complete len:398 (+),score=69.51 TRINITY_DN12275_c2_g1_i1:190-1383(+)